MSYCVTRAEAYKALRARGAVTAQYGIVKNTATACWERAADFATVEAWWGDRGGVRSGQAYEDGGTMLTWVEHPLDCFRSVRKCHDINRMDHTGWWTHPDGSDSQHGVVCRLPGRGGKPLFVVGHSDPHNDGPVTLDLEETYTDESEAARRADRIADLAAETEREYQTAWEAGNRVGEGLTKCRKARRWIKKLIAEMRTAKASAVALPTICTTLRDRIKSLRRGIARVKKKAEKLRDDYGREAGFENALSDYHPRVARILESRTP